VDCGQWDNSSDDWKHKMADSDMKRRPVYESAQAHAAIQQHLVTSHS